MLLGAVEVAYTCQADTLLRRARRRASTGVISSIVRCRIGKGPERPCQALVACRRVLHRLEDRQNIVEGPALDPVRRPAREIGRAGAHRDRRIDARTAAEHLAADRRSHHDQAQGDPGCDNPSRAPGRPRRGSRSRSRPDSRPAHRPFPPPAGGRAFALSSLSRFASTAPAEPPPTITMSNGLSKIDSLP